MCGLTSALHQCHVGLCLSSLECRRAPTHERWPESNSSLQALLALAALGLGSLRIITTHIFTDAHKAFAFIRWLWGAIITSLILPRSSLQTCIYVWLHAAKLELCAIVMALAGVSLRHNSVLPTPILCPCNYPALLSALYGESGRVNVIRMCRLNKSRPQALTQVIYRRWQVRPEVTQLDECVFMCFICKQGRAIPSSVIDLRTCLSIVQK